MEKQINDIDVVITWVDGNDTEWQKEKQKYLGNVNTKSDFSCGTNRYEDQGLLKYWFRGIEKFMPWVRNIFFVTCGHYPDWLDTSNPKLKLIKHSDFIPNRFLPTFNSNSIILNLHRIPNLSEQFIFFNDDMFVINNISSEKFFKNNLPADMAVQDIISAPDADPFWDMMINNLMIINKNFRKKQALKHNFCKWHSLKYGFKYNMKNFILNRFGYFPGFYDLHLPNSYLKSTFVEVWEKNTDICELTCLNKFRTSEDITEWTMRYWQLAKGTFYPINKEKLGRYVSLKNHSAINYLKTNPKMPLVCLNDSAKDYTVVINFFESILPDKCSFEK